MAWYDKFLKKVGINEPIPQHFSDMIDDFEAIKGEDGASFVKVLSGVKSLEIAQISVGTAAIEVKTSIEGRRSLELMVSGNDAVYIGPRSDVTIENGFPVLPGQSRQFELDKNNSFKLFAIAASPQTLKVIETN